MKAVYKLVRYSGMDEIVLSRHTTWEAAEKARQKWADGTGYQAVILKPAAIGGTP